MLVTQNLASVFLVVSPMLSLPAFLGYAVLPRKYGISCIHEGTRVCYRMRNFDFNENGSNFCQEKKIDLIKYLSVFMTVVSP